MDGIDMTGQSCMDMQHSFLQNSGIELNLTQGCRPILYPLMGSCLCVNQSI